MPQLLLELLSEEIPARMQPGAQRDLERMAQERLKAAQLPFDRLRAFAGPRRLTLVVDGLPAAQGDRVEERKGPRVGAPEQALAGFRVRRGSLRKSWSSATAPGSPPSPTPAARPPRSSPRWSRRSSAAFP